jgi:glycerol-3-phosphate cytidylyltransferase
MIVITFGTFDLFHEGHENILIGCRKVGATKIIVGVSSARMNYTKGKFDVSQSESVRVNVLRNHPLVDEVFLEESMDEKMNYIRNYKADLLVMGDDWIGRFDNLGCKTLYLPRTLHISSTLLRTQMQKKK